MYDTNRAEGGVWTRRRRPWWSVLFALALGAPTMAAAATPRPPARSSGTASPSRATEARSAGANADGDTEEPSVPMPVTAGDHPTRAPAHADCGYRMPLFQHTVAAGEHLGSIAGRYGVSRVELQALNPQLTDPNLIHPGDVIRVCPEIFPRLVVRTEHEVQPGESLGVIAQRHGLSLGDLIAQQDGRITDPNLVRVGQRLVIEVDGGLVPDFLPPEPSARSSRRGGGRRATVTRALPKMDHVHIKRPSLAYGTPKTIDLLQRAVGQYVQRHRGGPKVLIGDISKKGGGRLDPHVSHRTGRDVDMGYVLRGDRAHQTRFAGVNHQTLDLDRTWALMESFLDTGQVVYIFVDYRIQELLYEHAKRKGVPQTRLDELFQYPHGRRRAHGIIRHWPSHRNHFHVRFRS